MNRVIDVVMNMAFVMRTYEHFTSRLNIFLDPTVSFPGWGWGGSFTV